MLSIYYFHDLITEYKNKYPNIGYEYGISYSSLSKFIFYEKNTHRIYLITELVLDINNNSLTLVLDHNCSSIHYFFKWPYTLEEFDFIMNSYHTYNIKQILIDILKIISGNNYLEYRYGFI